MSSTVREALLLSEFEDVPHPSAGEETTPTEGGDAGHQSSSIVTLSPRWKPQDSADSLPEAAAYEVKAEDDAKGVQLSTSHQAPRSPLPLEQDHEHEQAASGAGGSWRQPRPTDLLQPSFPARRRLRIYPTGNRTSKWVTREIAALQFLTGIRMRNEADIRARDGGGISASIGEDLFHASSGARAAGLGRGRLRVGFTPGGGEFAVPEGGRAPEEDSDSDEGWLDQPSAGAGGGDEGARLTGATKRVNTAVAGRWMPGLGSPAAPARRLRGREALHVRIPPTFRHHMQSLLGHGAAVVRQWEQELTQQERLLEGRLFFSCSKGYPVAVSSVIHYKPKEEEDRRMHQKRIDELGAEVFKILKRDWRGHSYAYLLRRARGALPTSDTNHHHHNSYHSSYHHHHHSSYHHHHHHGSVATSGESAQSGSGPLDYGEGELQGLGGVAAGGDGGGRGAAEVGEAPYVAGFLDDPALKVGKHRHVARGDRNTGPVVSSVLLFVKPRVLKDELNARFREEHPSLPPSLTLSKIRSIKRQALLGCHRAGIEVATVALACIYLERLCLAGWVTKPNRRLAMAACLAIAYKFNEPVLMEGASKLPALWAFVDHEWQVSKKRVLEAEFGVLVKLCFDLHEDPRDIFHHFALLLKMVDSNASLYLGEDMMKLHHEALETFREGGNDEVSATGGGGGGADKGSESPRIRSGSNALTGDVRVDAVGSQGFSFMETSGWLQRRRAGSGSRWLAGWRGAIPEENTAAGGTASTALQTASSVIDTRQTSGKARSTFTVGKEPTEEQTKKRGRAVATNAVGSSSGGWRRAEGGSSSGSIGKSSTPSFLARVSSRRPHTARSSIQPERALDSE